MRIPRLHSEVSLIDPDKPIDELGETATNFITEISGDGIWVHPEGQGPDATTHQATSATTGWHIANALELFKSGINTFAVQLQNGVAKLRLGEPDKSRMELDYHSMQMVDKDGYTYFHVSDLRTVSSDTVSVTDTFTSDGTTTKYFLSSLPTTSASVTVKVNGSAYSHASVSTNLYTIGNTSIYLATIDFASGYVPASGATITAEYATSDYPKACTFGSRSDGNVGPTSAAEGVGNRASALASHAEGFRSFADAPLSHAEGSSTASGLASHAEGTGVAKGSCSHAQNSGTMAAYAAQTAMGKYNANKSDTLLEVGNGLGDGSRSNAFEVENNGNVRIPGHVRNMSGTKLYADASHGHSASDITSGTLPVARGGTGSTQTSTASNAITAGSNVTIQAQTVAVWGKVATVYLWITTTAAIADGAVIATIGSAYKPATIVYMEGRLPSYNAYMDTDGEIHSTGSMYGSTNYYFQATYVIA